MMSGAVMPGAAPADAGGAEVAHLRKLLGQYQETLAAERRRGDMLQETLWIQARALDRMGAMSAQLSALGVKPAM